MVSSAHGRPAVGAEDLGHRREGVVEPVRGLEEDHGAALVGDLAQSAETFARLSRKEALEAETVDGQRGQGKSREHCGRAGDRGDLDVLLHGCGHEPVAGIGDGRHPGVRDQQDAGTAGQCLDEFGRTGRLIALEVGHDPPRGVDAERLREAAQPSGVLGGDHIGRLQFGGEAWRGVRHIADGGSCEYQRSSRSSHMSHPPSTGDSARTDAFPTMAR